MNGSILTTWFAAPPALIAMRFRLRRAREVRDPFTRGPVTLVGPTYEPDRLDGLPFFEVQALEPAAVALLFEVDALEELDRTRAEGGSAQVRNAFEDELPALYRIPADAVGVFGQSEVLGADRAAAFAKRLRAENLDPGFRLATQFGEQLGPWDSAAFPNAESELIEAFITLIGCAAPDAEIYGLAEEL